MTTMVTVMTMMMKSWWLAENCFLIYVQLVKMKTAKLLWMYH